MEQWKPIIGFPGYSISDTGRVRNDDTGRVATLSRNQTGLIYVGLMRGRQQCKRGVAAMVARAFLAPPLNEAFDTPIHLDGDPSNNRVENLMWRPRWFAFRYQMQFSNGRRGWTVPIRETHTGEEFPTSWDAAIKYGLIDREIMQATINNTFVWPTYQVFKVIE